MKLLSYLLMCSILLLAIFAAGCTDAMKEPETNRSIEKSPELTLTIVPQKEAFQRGEIVSIKLILKNIGKNTLNVCKMYEKTNYDVSFVSSIGTLPARYKSSVASDYPINDASIVELKPGDSLNTTFDSYFWTLSHGEYNVTIVYHTENSTNVSKPYWRGTLKSNEVSIEILDTPNNLPGNPL